MLINAVRADTPAGMNEGFSIFALSDATGDLANSMAVAAVNQFPSHQCQIVRLSKINNTEKLTEAVLQAKERRGVILFTFVSSEMRHGILQLAEEHQVVAVDVMGQTLDALSNYFHTLPSSQPGLQYKLTQKYFKRTEAVEFTVKHDDGLGLDSISQADIVLLGISRTSKTPLSIYLAYHGYRCANIPVVKDIPLPAVVHDLDRSKIVALTIDSKKLSTIRSVRLSKLGRPNDESYAKLQHIQSEIDYANRLYRSLRVPMIDVTGRAIEESASEVLNILKL